jgi:cell division protein FtsB
MCKSTLSVRANIPDICMNMRKSFIFRLKIHYVLILIGFIVWMLFFDEKDFYTQRNRSRELANLEQKITQYDAKVKETRRQIEALDRDPAMLEKYAREKYFMKRDNEEVYIIESPEK